jgi:hypothetical protein
VNTSPPSCRPLGRSRPRTLPLGRANSPLIRGRKSRDVPAPPVWSVSVPCERAVRRRLPLRALCAEATARRRQSRSRPQRRGGPCGSETAGRGYPISRPLAIERTQPVSGRVPREARNHVGQVAPDPGAGNQAVGFSGSNAASRPGASASCEGMKIVGTSSTNRWILRLVSAASSGRTKPQAWAGDRPRRPPRTSPGATRGRRRRRPSRPVCHPSYVARSPARAGEMRCARRFPSPAVTGTCRRPWRETNRLPAHGGSPPQKARRQEGSKQDDRRSLGHP